MGGGGQGAGGGQEEVDMRVWGSFCVHLARECHTWAHADGLSDASFFQMLVVAPP